MSPDRRFFNVFFVILLSLVLIFTPITPNVSKADMYVFAQGTIAFTPSISTIDVTQTLVATPLPTIAPTPDYSIGSKKHPVGDIFHDAEHLRISAERSDLYGKFGLATLQDDPEYRLIWYKESVSVTHYLIIKMDDVLYAGENGYLQHFEAYLSNLDKMHASGVAGVGGAATILGLGIAGCTPSLGAGCIVGAVGGALSLIGGLIGEAYYYHNGVKPEIEALQSLFQTIDSNR